MLEEPNEELTAEEIREVFALLEAMDRAMEDDEGEEQ